MINVNEMQKMFGCHFDIKDELSTPTTKTLQIRNSKNLFITIKEPV